jgi:hypothetical protein
MKRKKNGVIAIGSSLCLLALLAGCDEEENPQPTGGGQGSASATPADVQASIVAGDGFGAPEDSSTLGSPSYTSSSVAKIDSDGDPSAQGFDANWQPDTSGHVNGGAVNAAVYRYVVMSSDQMTSSGAQLGDWATVTNNATGQTTWARVEDQGPKGGTGEISEAAATAVGIQYTSNRFTVGTPSVTVKVYGGSAGVQGSSTSPPNIIP